MQPSYGVDDGIGTIDRPVSPSEKRKQTAKGIVALLQFILGFISIFAGIAECVKLHFWAKTFGSGILVGCLIILGAVVCFASAVKPRNICLSITTIACSCLSTVVCLAELAIAVLAIVHYMKGRYGRSYYVQRRTDWPDATPGLAVYGVLIAVMYIESTIAVATVCIFYRSMNDGRTQTHQMALPLMYYPGTMPTATTHPYYCDAQPGTQPHVFNGLPPYSPNPNSTGPIYVPAQGQPIASLTNASNGAVAHNTEVPASLGAEKP